MSKDPAFLFYPGDWLGGTLGMTLEEKGAYLELLICQFNSGHMTSHMVGRMVGQVFGQIQEKFKKDENGLWYNERLDKEIEKRKSFISSRLNNLKGINQYTKNEGHMGGHLTSHAENENIDIIIKKRKGGVGERKGENEYPNLDQVKSYFIENGYSEQSAVKAFNYYSVAGWKDSNGKQVRNWKQKMQSVWFKDENKKQSGSSSIVFPR